MVAFALAIVSIGAIAAQLYLGIAICGFGPRDVIRREKSPGPYWFVMAVQVFIAIGILLLVADAS
jgi:hypothetical protein